MPWSMPAIVLIIVSAASSSSSASLAQVAFRESLRRLIVPAATWKVSTVDIPPPFPTLAVPEPPVTDAEIPNVDKTKAGADEEAHAKDAELGDEKTWRARMDDARATLEHDQLLADAMQTRINVLLTDFVNRDDPAQRAEIERQRVRALDELDRLKKQITKDTEAIAAVEEDARKKGIPPGWIR